MEFFKRSLHSACNRLGNFSLLVDNKDMEEHGRQKGKMSLSKLARELYLEGYNCTEAILHAMKQTGHPFSDEVLRSATGFRAGIGGSGCICGAISGATIAIGLYYGRLDKSEDSKKANDLCKHIYDKFKENYDVPCCNLLTADYKFDSPERKTFCSNIVGYVAEELEGILNKENKI